MIYIVLNKENVLEMSHLDKIVWFLESVSLIQVWFMTPLESGTSLIFMILGLKRFARALHHNCQAKPKV